jgi:hypothetical protein
MRNGLLECAAEERSLIFRQMMNFKVVYEWLHYNEILVASGGLRLGGKFKLILGGLCKESAVQGDVWVATHRLL